MSLVFVIQVVQVVFRIIYWAVLIRVLLSWFVTDSTHPLLRILDDVTEPILAPIRRLMPRTGMVDFSPLVALLILQVAEGIVVSLLRGLF